MHSLALGAETERKRALRLLVGVGFLGAFTSYAQLAVDTVVVSENSHPLLAAGYALATIAAGAGAAWLGIAPARRWATASIDDGMIVTTCLVALAGGVGAALRLGINGAVHRRVSPDYPVAMFGINVTGSFVLGLVSGMAAGHVLPEQWVLLIGVGLVGGFTAFSTTSFQTLRLIQEHHNWLAIANSFGMFAAAILVARLGLWLGTAL